MFLENRKTQLCIRTIFGVPLFRFSRVENIWYSLKLSIRLHFCRFEFSQGSGQFGSLTFRRCQNSLKGNCSSLMLLFFRHRFGFPSTLSKLLYSNLFAYEQFDYLPVRSRA